MTITEKVSYLKGLADGLVLDENNEEIDLRQSFDNDDAGFVPDDKTFQNVNDVEQSDEFIIDEESEENDIFIRAEADDDEIYADFEDDYSAEDFGLDFESSEDDYN